jgi:hypothetical protein
MTADTIVLMLFGGITALLSAQLPLGTLRSPGSGLFPLALGLMLMGLAVCHLLQLRRVAAAPLAAPQEARGSRGRVLLFLGAMVLGTALLEVLGFPLVAFLLMLALLEIFGLRRRRDAALIALCTAVAAYVLFVQWLKIPLPKGWLGL